MSGPSSLSLAGLVVAFVAGLISFLSPCVLPMVPVYLGILAGGQPDQAEQGRARSALLVRSLAFVLGFSAVFILLGLSATALGQLLVLNHLFLSRLAGAVVLVMAAILLLLAAGGGTILARERRFHLQPGQLGPFFAPVAGAAFALGWTPCVGPVLAAVLALSASQTGARDGAVLLAIYSAGLGLPFLAAAMALGRADRLMLAIRRHLVLINSMGALMLAGFGLLLLTGSLAQISSLLARGAQAVGLGALVNLG